MNRLTKVIPLVLIVVCFLLATISMEDDTGGTMPPPINTVDAQEAITTLVSGWRDTLNQAAEMEDMTVSDRQKFVKDAVETKARLFALAINTRVARDAGDSEQIAARVFRELADGLK